jgi:hypothetical protein
MGEGMATAATNRELIEAVAEEMATGIHRAVEFWMTQIELVFEDTHMTTLGRLQAIKEILKNYHSEQASELTLGRGHAA